MAHLDSHLAMILMEERETTRQRRAQEEANEFELTSYVSYLTCNLSAAAGDLEVHMRAAQEVLFLFFFDFLCFVPHVQSICCRQRPRGACAHVRVAQVLNVFFYFLCLVPFVLSICYRLRFRSAYTCDISRS